MGADEICLDCPESEECSYKSCPHCDCPICPRTIVNSEHGMTKCPLCDNGFSNQGFDVSGSNEVR